MCSKAEPQHSTNSGGGQIKARMSEAVGEATTVPLTVGTTTTGMEEQNIVVALDASEQAENAVKWYLEKCHRPGNKIVFVHCVELPEMNLNQARNFHMSPGVLASMWKEEETKTKALEEKMKGYLKEKGVPGVLRTATGKPGEVILKVAEEENAAMIVTATRGMGKVRRTILGSVSDYLVHHATCPVIVCRTPADKTRRPSGSDGKKSRHSSGESFTQKIRSRFASGGKARSQSVSSEASDAGDNKENNLLEGDEKS